MWFSESFWRNLWFFVPRRCLLSCVLYISHIFSTGSYNWFCTLIWSCLISSVWSHLLIWSYIFSSILSSVRSFHKFSWVFLCSCKSVVWKTLMELPLMRPLLVPVFFFRLPFLMWTNFVSSALDSIVLHFDTLSVNFLLLCVSGMDNWCRIASCRLRNSHWGSFTGASQAICQVNVLYQMIRPLSNYRFITITVNQFW